MPIALLTVSHRFPINCALLIVIVCGGGGEFCAPFSSDNESRTCVYIYAFIPTYLYYTYLIYLPTRISMYIYILYTRIPFLRPNENPTIIIKYMFFNYADAAAADAAAAATPPLCRLKTYNMLLLLLLKICVSRVCARVCVCTRYARTEKRKLKLYYIARNAPRFIVRCATLNYTLLHGSCSLSGPCYAQYTCT